MDILFETYLASKNKNFLPISTFSNSSDSNSISSSSTSTLTEIGGKKYLVRNGIQKLIAKILKKKFKCNKSIYN